MIGRIGSGCRDHDHLRCDRLEICPEVHGTLEYNNALRSGLHFEVSQDRLIGALRIDRTDNDARPLLKRQQGHGSEIHLGPAIHGSGGAEAPRTKAFDGDGGGKGNAARSTTLSAK
jgi:hypothetical protein